MIAVSMSKLQALTQPPDVVDFFRGLFDEVGIVVTDTGESFTARHHGDRVEFVEGVDEDQVDFTVPIVAAQIDRLADHIGSGELGEAEEYRIVRTLFTPATQATLRNPMMTSPLLRWLLGVGDLIHVHLRSPLKEEEDESHTLIYAAKQWIVVPGLHGRARRVFDLSTADALEYHRRTFQAIHADTFGAWWSFAGWYKKWRKSVSKTL